MHERRAPSTTYGWGIVYWDDLLDGVRRIDSATAQALRTNSRKWAGQRVCVRDRRPVHLGGTGYGLSRQRLIDVLARRASELGVRIEHESDVVDAADLTNADLVVLADGAHSRQRRRREQTFGSIEWTGTNKYLWLGSTKTFPDFTFAFEATPAGWIWLHAYPFAAAASTVIVECREGTWRGLGFDSMTSEACVQELSRIFARHLDGHRIELSADDTAAGHWATFTTVRNERWHAGNLVLVGDSAHTAHFSIGSGTRMAFEDAAALARSLKGCRPADLTDALQRYQDERRPAVLNLQRDAATSAAWFEDVDRHMRLPPLEFGYALRMRRESAPGSPLHHALHRVTQWRVGRTARRSVTVIRRAVATRRR
ncbi:FAD-dependent monooxygenase [Geodermatophilus sp. YIM 151500]|uniref:FAD-dependent monooxygenase n=1 Tax=Geodermatophilus sp. YIM 151500 TaxID=2984531 RepID=UPI0021E473EE|nr:FAD-dependent monooxygenase [Geodermatophilus sp. YIM 151500]MCV2490657.1 FAD-dependent monooxygenase [Geodermatophilus sp. YIM 151500]